NLEGTRQLLASPAAAAVAPESRWQAAWNFVRHLQLEGQVDEAFAQIEAWGAAEEAPESLRLKFLWLAAQLTLETGRSAAETEQRVEALRAFLRTVPDTSVSAEQRAEVESNAALLLAQAKLQSDASEAAGLQAMDALRREFPDSRAAIYSFIIQAHHLSEKGQLVEAQKLLRELADKYPKSEYAPRALYEAAEQARRRGADAYLNEAKDLLEKLVTNYPES